MRDVLLGLTYSRVIQNNFIQRGMRKPNSSVYYYFVGPEEREKEATDSCSPYGPSVHPDVFRALHDSLKACNPVVRVFSSAMDWEAEEVDFHIVQDTEDGVQACRVDVCSVLERPQSSIPGPREIVIFKRNQATGKQKAERIKSLEHCLYETLTYPLIFHFGEKGWTSSMQSQMTLLEYIRARLFVPEASGGRALTYVGGRGANLPCSRLQGMAWLGQQYALDAFCRLEEQRLQFQARNQKMLTRGNERLSGTFLSKSVQGSVRHLKEQTANALAVMRKLGKPLLFITM